MAKFRIIVEEIQLYEVYVEADDSNQAEEQALEVYGCDGEITHTQANVTDITEVK